MDERRRIEAMVRGADTTVACEMDADAVLPRDADLVLATGPVTDAPCPVVLLDATGAIRGAPWAH